MEMRTRFKSLYPVMDKRAPLGIIANEPGDDAQVITFVNPAFVKIGSEHGQFESVRVATSSVASVNINQGSKQSAMGTRLTFAT